MVATCMSQLAVWFGHELDPIEFMERLGYRCDSPAAAMTDQQAAQHSAAILTQWARAQ